MDKLYRILRLTAALTLCLLVCNIVYARKGEKTVLNIEIVGAGGKPVSGAVLFSSSNRYVYVADKNGRVSSQFYPDDILKIKARGYQTRIMSASEAAKGKVELKQVPMLTDEMSSIPTLFGETNERRTVGSYSKVDGDQLEKSPTMQFMNSLGGRLNGLFTMDNNMEPGSPASTNFVRMSSGGYTIMIDGVERSVEFLEPETIESVTLLKDASLKSLYGGAQSNGIIMIRTKRGKEGENSVSLNVQSGIQMPTRLPGYLNSYDYTTMLNGIMANAGYDPYYNPGDYLGADRDQVLYPDVDYYDMFLKKSMNITRANAQITGGNKKTRYFAHLGYQHQGGLEKYTDYATSDEVMTVRGNVDNTIYGFITLRAGFNAALETKQWPNMTGSEFFGMLSDNRPNEFPILIPGERVGRLDKEFVLGGTDVNRKNVYGHLTQKGYSEREYTFIQSDFTLDVDLGRWIKGFSVKPAVTFDVYNGISATQGGTFAVYEMIPATGVDPEAFRVWGTDMKETQKSRSGNQTQRNFAFHVTAEYNRNFGKHSVNALMVHYQQTKQFSGKLQSLKRINTALTANYMYDNKYVVDASINRVGVGSFAPFKRFGWFPTAGAAWILSEEDFMAGVRWLDFLKVRASYGVMGSTTYTTDRIFSSNLYRDRWSVGGTYAVGGGFNDLASLSQTGNPGLSYQKTYELNAGIDFILFNQSLRGSFGYYRNKLDGAFAPMSDMVPGVLGGGTALPMRNYKQEIGSGWEGELDYSRNFGDWNIGLGANFCFGKAEIKKTVEPDFPEGYEGLRKVTTMNDIKGLTVIGTFKDQADIDNSPMQQYGDVKPGDLKYFDRNDDGYVNDKDMAVIGNNMPSWQYGINVSIEWKGFNLDLSGYGLAGFERVLDNKYYQIYGTRKYSNVLKDGLPNGKPHPTLRAEYSNNNFKSSDYWTVKGGFFKLRNAELGYTLPHKTTAKIGINKLKVFVRGFNLFTISKIKDLDPECLTAGLTSFPLFTTITGGVSVSF